MTYLCGCISRVQRRDGAASPCDSVKNDAIVGDVWGHQCNRVTFTKPSGRQPTRQTHDLIHKHGRCDTASAGAIDQDNLIRSAS